MLIASGSNNSNLPDDSTIEAPLAINVRSSKASTAPSDSSLIADAIQGTKVTIPVSVQKSTGSLTPSRRRDWSEEEDTKLTAAVQKYGEPDWGNIAEGDFENGRSALELSKVLYLPNLYLFLSHCLLCYHLQLTCLSRNKLLISYFVCSEVGQQRLPLVAYEPNVLLLWGIK